MSVLLLIISIIAFIIATNSFIKKIDYYRVYYTGLLSLILSIYSFTRYISVVYLLSDYRMFVHFAEYMSLAAFSYPVLKIIQGKLNPKYDKIIALSIFLVFINLVTQVTLTLMQISDFEEMLNYTYAILFMTFFVSMVLFLLSDSNKYTEKNTLVISILPLFISLFVSLIMVVHDKKIHLSLLVLVCIAIFIVHQSYLMMNVYIKSLEEKSRGEWFEKLASVDFLTQLKNRYSFEKELKNIVDKKIRVVLISIDLNNLKTINDTMGHSCGDKAIITIANFLRDNIKNATVFRTGGDEFVVICYGEFDDEDISKLKSVSLMMESSCDSIPLSFAIGHSVYDPAKNINISEVLTDSDKKMYIDKMKMKSF